MHNNFIPDMLKEKIVNFFRFSYGLFLISISLFIILSLATFNIADNSFLVKTSNLNTNLMGIIGSYIASFLIYTFGSLSYLTTLFLMLYGVLIFLKKNPKYFFIRIFVFFFGLALTPQLFIFWAWDYSYYNGLKPWGEIANIIYNLHTSEVLSYTLSFVGAIFILSSISIFSLLKFSKSRFSFFQKNISSEKYKSVIKKEPIIQNKIQTKNYKTDSTFNNIEQDLSSKNNYFSPSLEILDNDENLTKRKKNSLSNKETSELLERVFADFNIEIKVINTKFGPVVTLYEILPAAGIKINTIINLADDISRSMGVGAVRIAQILGTQYLGVEVPNETREAVTIKELLSDINFKDAKHKIPICIGKNISGNIEVIDLSKTPHLLVAGTTGSGKSVFINTLLASILYKFSPDDLKLILIDPKMLELSVYNDIAHLLTPVVTEPKKAIIALKWVCKEMERRYSLMNEENTRSLEAFNQKVKEKIPYIVVVIDEMADLMMTAGKEVEHYVQRLAQMARACGIHLVMATQRPSVDIITGSIKANFPSRISFQVASKYDSRTVLGEIGAEQLLGNGDMLLMKNGGNILRYQSAFISDSEVTKLINEIKKGQSVKYLTELENIIKNNEEDIVSLNEEDEELISKSIDLIRTTNKASTSFLQRNFQIGYNKAARIMESLEKRGIVSEPNHNGKRDILIQ